MHRVLAIAAACIVIWTTNFQAQTAARPLLHLDFVVDSQGPNLVTVATSLDGKRVAAFEAGEAVWSPDGLQFAALANTGRQNSMASEGVSNRQPARHQPVRAWQRGDIDGLGAGLGSRTGRRSR